MILNSIMSAKTCMRAAAGYVEYHLNVDVSPICDASLSLLNSWVDVPPETRRLVMWVPASVIAENRCGQLISHSTAHPSCKPHAQISHASHSSEPRSSSLARSLQFSPSMLQPLSSPSPPPPSSLLTEYLCPRPSSSHIIDLTRNDDEDKDDEDKDMIDLTLD